MLHSSIQTVKFLLKSVNLCKCMAWCPDVLADKLHPQFYTKILSKKVRLIRRCLRYILFLIIHVVASSTCILGPATFVMLSYYLIKLGGKKKIVSTSVFT